MNRQQIRKGRQAQGKAKPIPCAPPSAESPSRMKRMRTGLALLLLGGAAFGVTYLIVKLVQPSPSLSEGMVWIPGGEFTMGTDEQGWADEKPAHRVRVAGFWMDQTETTNAQFRAFVEATGFVTTAEKKPVWEELRRQLPPGTPKPADSTLVAGSMVFVPTAGPVDLTDFSQWLKWTPGAGSTPKGRKALSTARRIIPSSTSPGMTRWRMPSGRGSVCRRRRNGSSRRVEGWTASRMSGATSGPTPPAPTSGRASSPTGTQRPMATSGPRR